MHTLPCTRATQLLCGPHNKSKGSLNTTDYAAHPELCSPGRNVVARQTLEARIKELEAEVAQIKEQAEYAFWELHCMQSAGAE
jgi:hypothetical protein